MTPATLTQTLSRLQVATPEDAVRFVRFALRVVRDAPLGNGYTPAEVLAGRPVFAEALDAIGRFADSGEWQGGERLWVDVLRAADLVAPFGDDLAGPGAAAWAVFQLVLAAERTAAHPDDPEALEDAAAHATLAADLAARSGGNGYSPESVRFLTAIAARTFGLAGPDGGRLSP